jgi:hypothetical protein
LNMATNSRRYSTFKSPHHCTNMTWLCLWTSGSRGSVLKRISSETFQEKIWGYLRIACDPTVPKIGDFVVESFREFEAIYKKALTQVSVA